MPLSQEPSTVPSQAPAAFNPDVNVHKQTFKMLKGFAAGVRGGTYKGEHLIDIAMGVQFLDQMIAQSEGQLQYAIRLEKEAEAAAREARKNKPDLQVVGATDAPSA